MTTSEEETVPGTAGGFPGEEVFDARHPIRHVFFEVPGATRLAVVFSGFEYAHKPRYNYIERFSPLACHRLHILDDMGSRGCYYLGADRDFFVARSISELIDQRLRQVRLTRSDVVTVGSSKGATAAIYHAIAFDYGGVPFSRHVLERLGTRTRREAWRARARLASTRTWFT